ncbi:MAG TPA: alpha/beta fold hydrolase [Roseiflexaceae bacterium]|nr:alpha/beta fold hydrolase [Roseiflexaceae bacterium]
MQHRYSRTPHLQAAICKLQSLYDPLSSAFVPLVDGLARHRIICRGATQHEARIGGITINYYQRLLWGPPAPHTPWRRNMPMLLIHGIGDSALTWALVLRRLALGHDVYALDLPGHGLSGLPPGRRYATLDEHTATVVGFVRQVIGRPALLVGNSLGGMLAVRAAWCAPELIRGLVLLNPGGAPLQGRAAYDAFFAKIADPRLRTAYRVGGELFGAVPRPLLLLILRSLQHMFQRPVILEAYRASDDRVLLTAEQLRRLPVPAALIWGLRDRFLPEGSLAFFDEHLPGAPKLLLPRCGHLPQRECPLSVVRFVRAFASSLDTRHPGGGAEAMPSRPFAS